jgi:hypothetical protein
MNLKKSKTKIEDFEFLYSVDRLAQLVIFENLFESNQTVLPKYDLFPMDVRVMLIRFSPIGCTSI